jgi:DNA replication and repair protein RecF
LDHLHKLPENLKIFHIQKGNITEE